MRILGVDPGSITTGFGVIDHVRGKVTLVEQGSISAKKTADLADRLCLIHTGLLAVIERTRPEAVAVETPFAGRNVKSLVQLAHARGVVLLAARGAQLPLYEYSPSSIKSAVVGYGRAEKEQIARMVRVLLPSIEGDLLPDSADALAVAICHAHTGAFAARARVPIGGGRRSLKALVK